MILRVVASLGLVVLSLAKSIVVPFYDTAIQYDSRWVVDAPATATNASSTSVEVCPADNAGAFASIPGASFSFAFYGTSVSISTSSGPSVSSYSVTRDNGLPVAVQPALLDASACRVTFQSAELELGTHAITLTLPSTGDAADALTVLSISYDDGQSDNTAKPSPQAAAKKAATISVGALFAIAACSVLGSLALAASLIWLCCIRDRRRSLADDDENSVKIRRLETKEKALGILSSTPTFLRHDRTKRVRTHIRLGSDQLATTADPTSTGFSGFTLLRPPVPKKPQLPVPAQPARPLFLQVQNRNSLQTVNTTPSRST